MVFMVFLIFDTKVASNGPGTHLKRCGSKFCVGWWLGDLHSSHMDPIGEKTVVGFAGGAGGIFYRSQFCPVVLFIISKIRIPVVFIINVEFLGAGADGIYYRWYFLS